MVYYDVSLRVVALPTLRWNPNIYSHNADKNR